MTQFKSTGERTSLFKRNGPSDVKVVQSVGVNESLPHPSIPRVTCPACGSQMRLAEALLGVNGEGSMYYDCKCGFEYRLPVEAQ